MQEKGKNIKEGGQGKSQVTAVDSVSSLMHEDKDLKEFFFFPPQGKIIVFLKFEHFKTFGISDI